MTGANPAAQRRWGWVLPCAVMTLSMMLIGLLAGANLPFDQVKSWALLGTAGVLVCAIFHLVVLVVSQRGDVMCTAAGYGVAWTLVIMAGINSASYNTVKTVLNRLGFHWDELFADIDAFLFGGDPWVHLTWIAGDAAADFYYIPWMIALVGSLIYLGRQDPGEKRHRLIVTYFATWSIGGVLVQLAFQAAGPVFYENIGLGDRFADLPYPDRVALYADYLWRTYESGKVGLGSGISAMPSLHVATSYWVVLVFYRTWLFVPAIIMATLILIISVSTGWHYAIDGFVAIAMVHALYWLSGKVGLASILNRFQKPERAAPSSV